MKLERIEITVDEPNNNSERPYKYEAFAHIQDEDRTDDPVIGGIVGYSDMSPWDAVVQARSVLESLGFDLGMTAITFKDARGNALKDV